MQESHQRLFAAGEMRYARNIEHQAVGAIEGGKRGEARAPVAQTLEKPRLFRRIRLDRDEGGMARARVRQRQSGRQAEPRGVGVDADEPLGVLDPGDRRERRALVNGLSRRARSVARRGSQRERNRRVVKVLSSLRHSSLTVRPDPPEAALLSAAVARAAEARLDEPRPAGEAAWQIAPRRRRDFRALGAAAISKRVSAALESLSAWP